MFVYPCPSELTVSASEGFSQGSRDNPTRTMARAADDVEHRLDPLDPMSLGIAPLPEEKYPRVMEKRTRTRGWYVALGIILSLWSITPLSW